MCEETADAAERAIAVDDQTLLFRLEFVPGNIQRDSGLAGEAFQFSEQGAVLRLRPRLDRAFVQRFVLVGDDEVEVEVDRVAETLAAGTGAIGIVE